MKVSAGDNNRYAEGGRRLLSKVRSAYSPLLYQKYIKRHADRVDVFRLTGSAILAQEISVQRKQLLVRKNCAERVGVLVPRVVIAVVEQLPRSIRRNAKPGQLQGAFDR